MSIDTMLKPELIHWGVMLAQGWKGELVQTPHAECWPTAREWAQRAERLGFHGVWMFDHFQPYPARDDSPLLEAWTTLAALSQVTERAVIGTLVACASYRQPMVTVKMAENLHRLSEGRFCLGLGAGWDRPEFQFLGLPFPSAVERSDRLEAVLRACHVAWNKPGPGDSVPAVDIASGTGTPPLLVGGEGERRTLPAAAAFADAVNWQVGVQDFIRKSRVLRAACVAAGRDPGTVRLTHAPNFQLFDSEREFARWRQDDRRGMSSEEVYAYIRNRGALYGTASTIEETIEQFTDAGCRGFMVFCNGAPEVSALEQLASLPPVRRTLGQPSEAASGMVATPPCAVCGSPSARVELVAPGGLPADRGQPQENRNHGHLHLRGRDHWLLLYSGPAAGNGSGDVISADRAAVIAQAFREPYTYARVHTAGFYDDAGFCERCKVPYCSRHWRVSGVGVGHCPQGHGKSLDPLY